MTHELLVTLITALLSSGGGVGAIGLWLSKKQKDRDDIQARRDQERDRQVEDSRVWFEQSKSHYQLAKDEVIEARQQCADCLNQLRVTRRAVYTLLENLEDQIIPALGLPDADLTATRRLMREAVHKAREAL